MLISAAVNCYFSPPWKQVGHTSFHASTAASQVNHYDYAHQQGVIHHLPVLKDGE